MSIHEDIARTSSTSDLDSISTAEGFSDIDRTNPELERQRQDTWPQLPPLRKTKSTPLTSSSGNTSETARSRKKTSFKIDLPPRNLNEFEDNYEKEEPITIVQETSTPTSTLPFYLPSLEESQTPLGILLPTTSSEFPVPPLDAASMASNNSDTDASMAEQGQSGQTTNMKLDFDSIAIATADYLVGAHLTAPTLDVVHQPLPFPLPSRLSGINSSTASLFSRLIDTLRHESHLNASHIRIQHVLLNNILPESYPISPLVTPSSLARNSDHHGYFAVKTLFSSISTSTGVALPPGQAHLCVTERVIPPSGEVEVLSFLSDSTDSGFMTRLNELAKGGIFILVLPTSHGGRTFHNDCLSKMLDPILRSIIFRLGLQSGLAKDISNAVVLKQLRSFEQMQAQIQLILNMAKTTSFFPGAEPSFSLVHASKGTISLTFESWYTWWLGQERTRIMGLLNYHINVYGQGLSSSSTNLVDEGSNATRTSIMLELDKEMRRAGSEQTAIPEIELAVFMVQRVE